MKTEDVCGKLTHEDVEDPLKSLNDIAMYISRKTGCTWLEAIVFIRDTLDKVVEKRGCEE